MYSPKRATIAELKDLCGEPSEKALRTRALEGVLHYVGSAGATQYFDESLSVIRCKAARKVKGPGITWKLVAQAVKRNSDLINTRIMDGLNQGKTPDELVPEIADLINSLR